ncbi:MAG TPA: Rid family hydrolase [Paucimonas sp.]|nr:Rid family hydrolase [Paucimonas sp.]
MRAFLLALSAFALLAGCAAPIPPAPAVGKTVVIPPGREVEYQRYRYAPAVRVGDTVILSGIPAYKGDGYAAKVRNMFDEVKRTLEHAGATLDDVVEITTFHAGAGDTAAFQQEFREFLKIHAEYFKQDYPAWTAVGKTTLLADGAPVEMRVVAVIGSGKRHAK